MRWRILLPAFSLTTFLLAATRVPLLSIVARFTAPGVPALGSDEHPVDRTRPYPTSVVMRPGCGVAQHPMVYAGEGYNNILLVNEGKVIWNYFTGLHGEFDDVWMLSNGYILFTRQFQIEEVTPEKKIIWHYDAPPGTEIHSCQPIDLNKVLLAQNGFRRS